MFDTETGKQLPDHVGACDRTNNCGYEYTATQYLREDRQLENLKSKSVFSPRQNLKKPQIPPTPIFDYIESHALVERLGNYDQNGIVRFLIDLFPNDPDDVEAIIAEYWIGTHLHTYGAYTLFPYLDEQKRFCRGKLIRFNPATGRRLKGDWDTSSLAAQLKLEGFRHKQIFFGEHLLKKYPNRPIAVVESEKSAILGALCKGVFPDMVWLASGSKQTLQVEKLIRIGRGRKILLFPDADGYDAWSSVAAEVTKKGIAASVSDLIEAKATVEERAAGADIADYLIREQRRINEHNSAVDLICLEIEREEREAIRAEGCFGSRISEPL